MLSTIRSLEHLLNADFTQCLMRLIDDWLLVSTSQTKAARFYDMVSVGTCSSRAL